MAQGPLAGALSTCNVKAWATGEGNEGLQLGNWLLRGMGGAGLEAALMRGVVARSHWKRWCWLWPSGALGQPAVGIKVAVNTAPRASLAGQVWGQVQGCNSVPKHSRACP